MISAIKVISGTAHPELAQDICKHLGTDLCRSTVVRFSNENFKQIAKAVVLHRP
jgi:phosphoribosylpyrophosphate synthetase